MLVLAAEVSETTVWGGITENTTWTLGGSPYVVTGDVIVAIGVLLKIEPGVVVKFENGTCMIVDGTLVAQGNSSHRITFTSNALLPAIGDWDGIRTRIGGHFDKMEWVTIEYSRWGIEGILDSFNLSDCIFRRNNMTLSGSNVNMTHCEIRDNIDGVDAENAFIIASEFHNNTNGIVLAESIENTNISHNKENGAFISGSVANCSVYNNGGYGVSAGGSVANCSVYNNGGYGVSAGSVANCSVYNNGGYGVSVEITYSGYTFSYGHAINCYVFNNSGPGIKGVWPRVINCLVYNNSGYGVEAGSVINCSISNNSGSGARANEIRGSAIFNNEGVGVVMQRGNAEMSNCSIHGNLAGGVQVNPYFHDLNRPPKPVKKYAFIDDTRIYNNLFGVLIHCSGTPGGSTYHTMRHVIISSCNISYNSKDGIMVEELATGFDFFNPYLEVLNTTIECNGRFGINFITTRKQQVTYLSIDEILGCTISNNTVGALGKFGNISDSTIIHNYEKGLEIYGVSTGINRNDIYDNGMYNIWNHVQFGQNINATQNWWGTTNKTLIDEYTYDYYDDFNRSIVILEPFLTTPIPEFPSFLVPTIVMIITLSTVICARQIKSSTSNHNPS